MHKSNLIKTGGDYNETVVIAWRWCFYDQTEIATIPPGKRTHPLVAMNGRGGVFNQIFLGIVRVTVEKAWGFSEESKSKTKKLFSKMTRAAPDCYAKIDVGGEESWRTATLNNTHKPAWNETHDFVVSDFDQCITVDVNDHDVNGDDDVTSSWSRRKGTG